MNTYKIDTAVLSRRQLLISKRLSRTTNRRRRKTRFEASAREMIFRNMCKNLTISILRQPYAAYKDMAVSIFIGAVKMAQTFTTQTFYFDWVAGQGGASWAAPARAKLAWPALP